MKIELNYQTSVFTLPASVLTKLDTASENDLKVLMYIASSERLREDFDAARLSTLLDLPASEIDLSVAFWRGAGVLRTGKSKKAREEARPSVQEKPENAPLPVAAHEKLPDYSGEELETMMAARAGLSGLLTECQKILHIDNLSPTESKKLVALSDYLHLSDDYIMLLCQYCFEKGNPRVSYVASTAERMVNTNSVTTFEALEQFINEEARRHDFEARMRVLLGLGQAKLSAKQKKFFENWQKMSLPFEVISFAYEQSVDATTLLSLPHLNKILENYHKEGVRSVKDAERVTEKHREEQKKTFIASRDKGKGDKADFKSFEADEFFNLTQKKKSGGS
ncbi:MAG: DnaD domain protein [Clostridia bacterium]|nr:DnaD domain protein [Clostridia bacterium]